jgi:hypothetical protein
MHREAARVIFWTSSVWPSVGKLGSTSCVSFPPCMMEFACIKQATTNYLFKIKGENHFWCNLSHNSNEKSLKLTHITRLSCPFGQLVESGFLPETSSRRTMPKAYTSILLFTLPCMKYSGARYLSIISILVR